MPFRTVGSPGTLSLAEFQRRIQQQESIYGPLVALGCEGGSNLMTFEVSPTAPASRIELEILGEGNPPAKPGHSLVCTGYVVAENKTLSVGAYRKLS